MIKLLNILSEELEKRLLNEQSNKAPSPLLDTHITSMFGIRRKLGDHSGVDLSAKVGTAIYAPEDGVVHYAVDDNRIYSNISKPDGKDRCGRRIAINHETGILSGLRTIYCHLSKIYVTKGQTVKKGDLIGLTGGEKGTPGAGNTTAPHLHLGVKRDGKYLNPLDYIDLKKGFDDMAGGEHEQSPISSDYETSSPQAPTKEYELSDEGFDEFIEDTFTQQQKDEIDTIDVELKDRNLYYVVYRKNNKPDMFYLFKNNSYKLQNI